MTKKTRDDIEAMREGGRILANVTKMVSQKVAPGVSTEYLDSLAEKIIRENNADPSFLGYEGYPKTICTSINNEVVHGIPKKDRILNEGDIIGLDLGVVYKGFHTDMAVTCPVGSISKEDQRLINVTKKSLIKGLSEVRDGARLGDIGGAIQECAENNGFSVVRDLTGHGIGRNLHEDPSIPNYGDKGTGEVIEEGETLAIEPMLNEGDFRVKMLDDGWTFVTMDGSKSAHFETTILVTKEGYENLVPFEG